MTKSILFYFKLYIINKIYLIEQEETRQKLTKINFRFIDKNMITTNN